MRRCLSPKFEIYSSSLFTLTAINVSDEEGASFDAGRVGITRPGLGLQLYMVLVKMRKGEAESYEVLTVVVVVMESKGR